MISFSWDQTSWKQIMESELRGSHKQPNEEKIHLTSKSTFLWQLHSLTTICYEMTTYFELREPQMWENVLSCTNERC